MSEKIEKWIFIGSMPRSGTSLLQAMLNAHSRICSPPESHLWDRFVVSPRIDAKNAMRSADLLMNFLNAHPKVARLGIDAKEIVDPFRGKWSTFKAVDMYRNYLQAFADKRDKPLLAEGSPTNIRNLKLLKREFPNSYVVHIVRDPRDVILSTYRADFSRGYLLTTSSLAEKFMTYYREGLRDGPAIYGDRYIRVYYEDLCIQPEKEVRRVCEIIGEEFEPAMLEYYKTADEVFAKSEIQWKKNLLKGVMTNNFGKWKREMRPEDALVVEYICADFFRREKRYELSEYSQKWSIFKKEIFLAPHRMRRLKARLKNRKPLHA